MSHDEIYWIEQQVRHVPYFQLHQTVLAQQEHVVPGGNPFIERGLLYSTNRKSMAALMAQDQDVFIPSQENKVVYQTRLPDVDLQPIEKAHESVDKLEEIDRVLTIEPGMAYERTEDVGNDLPQDNQPEPTELQPEDEVQDSSDDTPEDLYPTLVPSEPEHTEGGATPENEDAEFYDTLIQVEINEASEAPSIQALEQVPEAESSIEVEPEQTEATAIQKEVKPFRMNDKLDHRVQFRVQMFGWKAVMIRQEIESYKEQITGGTGITGKQSADFVISQPRKIIELPEVPLAMENTFVPDFEIEDTEPAQDGSFISEASANLPEEVQWDANQQVIQVDDAIELENPIPAIPTESDTDEEALPFRHNDLELDIIIHPSAHSKYLRKPTMDLHMHPAPRKEFVNLSTEVNTLPAKRRANRQRTLELIDKFIENESDLAIKPVMTEGKSVDISKPSVSDDSEIVSETLAQIYLKQGNKQKAIRIYQKLMLKFPEKSSYFESLLRNL